MDPEATVESWLASSSGAFHALKEQFQLGHEWTFSIESPDVVPQDASAEAIDDLNGAAAFTLRRIQALRHVLKRQPWEDVSRSELRMMASYVSDLNVFYSNLDDRNLLNSINQPVIEQARGDSRNLAASIALGLRSR
jgi:hypothetical protein